MNLRARGRGQNLIVHNPRFHLDHFFTRRRLSAYLDEELRRVDRDRVERHLAACPDCDRAARSLYRLVVRLSLLRRCHPSRLAADVIERVRGQTR